MTDCIHSIIDGFPDYLHKLALAERPTIPSPKRQRVETSVLGRLGGLVQDYSFEDMSFTLHYNYLEDAEDHQAFKQSFYIMRHWLNYAKKLEFSDDPNVYYVIQTIDIGDAENDIVEWGEFDVNITAKPFARVQEDVPI
ncbi:TPA: phage tail protein, partial [Enterococcus faecium]|nr:phage tail protein [Enterococcus faecium]